MNWPWVSRRAYDQVFAERDRLMVINNQLTDHLMRTDRVEHGMSEKPRKPREPLGDMPPSLVKHIAGFETPTIRRRLENDAKAARARGEPWETIEREMTQRGEDDV